MGEVTNEIILERLDNFIAHNSEEHKAIRESLAEQASENKELKIRVRSLEDWRLVFVAKYSVYSAIALFLGSLLSTVGINLIQGYISK